jgi:hypothetical protein
LAFIRDDHHMVWRTQDAATPPATLMAAHSDLMDELLSAFTPLFADHTGQVIRDFCSKMHLNKSKIFSSR